MDQSVTIVLDNNDILSEVCGANDGNLKLMERLLGSPVRYQGNEIRLESPDQKVRERFERLVEGLVESSREGNAPSPDLIRAIHSSLEGDRGYAEKFKDAFIQIPGGFGKIFPRSLAQAEYVAGMMASDISFCVGPAGTGKTFLAVAHALREVLGRTKRKLILTRPVVEAGESLGFLPGDLIQKIDPYLRPLYDAMETLIPFEAIRRLEESRLMEIAPLAYMRGRSLNDCVIILDEAQNTTREQMKMFLTRIGQGSRAIITGDTTQIDLPRKHESGLAQALAILSGIEGIHFSRLGTQDVVRHSLVRKIIEAYDAQDRQG